MTTNNKETVQKLMEQIENEWQVGGISGHTLYTDFTLEVINRLFTQLQKEVEGLRIKHKADSSSIYNCAIDNVQLILNKYKK